jgi:toluene monooxygenase system protein D
VGPVLEASPAGRAVVAAIEDLNEGVRVEDRAAYLRVEVQGRCVVTRDAIERRLGRPFRLPMDLEAVMPAFKGILSVDDDRAEWSYTVS